MSCADCARLRDIINERDATITALRMELRDLTELLAPDRDLPPEYRRSPGNTES